MGKQWIQWQTLFLFGSRITTNGYCSHEIKRRLLLGRKVMINLDSILKSRDMILPTKVHLVKALVFLVVMCGCKSWTIKKAECWRIDAFELWCWRSPLDSKEIKLVILKEINPEYSLEGLILKLKLQVWSPDVKHWCTWEDPDAGKYRRWEEKETMEGERVGWHHPLDGHELEQVPRVGDGQGGLACCSRWGCKESDMTERLNWTDSRAMWTKTSHWLR